jgi:hypothetical protein
VGIGVVGFIFICWLLGDLGRVKVTAEVIDTQHGHRQVVGNGNWQ